ncbi:MAG: SDR family NAD(P)-dependent oxidoreductase [Rhodoglobus sp.]
MPALIPSPFTRESTAAEVVADVDLAGKRAIVTGGASGIGVETARALALAGATVTLAVRDTTAGAAVADDIAESTGNGKVFVAPLDLSDRTSIAALVAAWSGPLHILVNNAGVMATPLSRTAGDWELQFATNHLGHFALATGLHDALAAADGARIVSVTSSAHLRSPVVFDDIMFERRAYDPWLAYGQSKTANSLFAVDATRRWHDDGIFVNAAMPGGIRTPLQRHLTDADWARMDATDYKWKTPEQGAATSLYVATSPQLHKIGGRYFEDVAEAAPNVAPGTTGFASYAVDPAAAEQLWDLSVGYLG